LNLNGFDTILTRKDKKFYWGKIKTRETDRDIRPELYAMAYGMVRPNWRPAIRTVIATPIEMRRGNTPYLNPGHLLSQLKWHPVWSESVRFRLLVEVILDGHDSCGCPATIKITASSPVTTLQHDWDGDKISYSLNTSLLGLVFWYIDIAEAIREFGVEDYESDDGITVVDEADIDLINPDEPIEGGDLQEEVIAESDEDLEDPTDYVEQTLEFWRYVNVNAILIKSQERYSDSYEFKSVTEILNTRNPAVGNQLPLEQALERRFPGAEILNEKFLNMERKKIDSGHPWPGDSFYLNYYSVTIRYPVISE